MPVNLVALLNMGQHDIPTAYENQLVALGRVLQTLRDEENADVLIDTTIDYLQAEFNYPLIWIGLYDRLDHRLFGKGGITPTGDIKFLKQRFILTPGDLLEQVVIQQRPVGVPDLREEVRAGEWRRVAQQCGIQGTHLFPLRCKDRCFGVILLGSQVWGTTLRPGEKAQLSLLLGELAAALYQIEIDWQRSATKRPDQTLFQLLNELVGLPTIQQRLEVLVSMTQQFIAPTRTNIYWYSAERRYFWHRVGSRHTSRILGDLRSSAAGITVQEVSDFYQALQDGHMVAIGAGRSPLKPEVTSRLLARLRTRSVLAAPIHVQQELVGFFSVEGNEARIWEEAEKNFIRAAAQLVALGASSEEMEGVVEQAKRNNRLTADVAKALAHTIDPSKALEACAELVLDALSAERFLILQKERVENGEGSSGNLSTTKGEFYYKVLYQRQPLNRRPLNTPLNVLSSTDRQTLEQSATAGKMWEAPIVIEDWEDNPQLEQWRDTLMQLGVRSLLVCPIQLKSGPNSQTTDSTLLVIGHNTPRTWNQSQRQIIRVISQQISLLLHSINLSSLIETQAVAGLQLQAGLTTLLTHDGDKSQFERVWVNFIAQMLECPLAAFLACSDTHQNPLGQPRIQVTTAVSADPRFALPPDLSVPLTDVLIQEVLSLNGLVEKRIEDLPAATRQWLSPGIGQLLVMALPSFGLENGQEIDFQSGGLLLLADERGRQWPLHLLPVVETLVWHFAQMRYYAMTETTLGAQVSNLEQLNWYKHRCLETLHQDATEAISRLQELESQSALSDLDRSLVRMRSSQLLHQLKNTLGTLTPLLNEEQWQLSHRLTQLPLSNLLKRSLRRVEFWYSQRQLMVRSYGIEGNQHVYGDRLKLECVLLEMLMMVGSRAPVGSRIHLSCKEVGVSRLGTRTQEEGATSNPSPMLELLITDSSLGTTTLTDTLHFKFLAAPKLPGLRVCQHILRSCGGELLFYQLEEDRYSIRLLFRTKNSRD